MRVSKAAPAILTVLLVAASCGGGAGGGKPAGQERGTRLQPANIPAALVLERELVGRLIETPLRGPTGVAYDGADGLYISDTRNHRVLKVDTTFAVLDDAGGFGAQTGLFNRPMYLAVDFALNILVADYGNRRVARYNSHLEYVDQISLVDPEDPLRFGNPMSAAVTSFGETWVTDPERNEIIVFDQAGQFQRLIGDFGYSGGQVESPTKIILDRQRRFVVCDSDNGRLVRYDLDGNFIDELGDRRLGYPVGVTANRDGYWLIDQETAELILLDDYGEIVAVLPKMLTGSDKPLKQPSDLAAIGTDRLVIVDTGNNRVLLCRIVYE